MHGNADHRAGRAVLHRQFPRRQANGQAAATVYKKHAGFCLEAQHFPDSVNHAEFPSMILKPGKTYQQTTIYKFSAK